MHAFDRYYPYRCWYEIVWKVSYGLSKRSVNGVKDLVLSLILRDQAVLESIGYYLCSVLKM